MRGIDLHTHTVVSDGTLSPTDLVALAARVGLAAIAVTDHDHVGAIAEARAAGARLGVEVVAGIELSVEHAAGELHLLGYLFDEHDAALLAALERLRMQRDARNARIVERLAELGMPVDLGAIVASASAGASARKGSRAEGSGAGAAPGAGASSVGRPHIARALVAAGHVASVQEAFDKYLGDGRAAFVPRARARPAEAIALVHAAGGVCALAHPGLVKRDASQVVRELSGVGLDAVEVWHPKNPPELRARLLALAEELGLAATGGSDFHGENKPDVTLGCEAVPLAALDALRQRKG